MGALVRDFHDLLMTAPVLITVQRGKDLRLELFNAYARKAVGGRDLTGRALADALPELGRWFHKIAKVVMTGTPYVGVDEALTFDWTGTGRTETRYLTSVCQPLEGAAGVVDGSVMFAIDVTASVAARAVSPRDRAWVEAALDAMPIPVMLAEPGTRRILFANAAALELSHGHLPSGRTFGQAVGLVTGYFCTDAAGSPIPDEALPAARASRGEVVEAMDLLWHTPFGVIPLVCFAEMVPAAEAFPPAIVLSFFDASRARRIERELFEATMARDEFLQLAGHELLTPLTALKLQVQSLLKQNPQAAGLAAVERATARMDAIIEHMLDSARIRDVDAPLEPEELDLCAAVDDVIESLRAEAARVGSAVTRTGAPVIRGRWDKTRLEHVLRNLVNNALRFGGGKPVCIRCNDAGKEVSLDVEDCGIGIAPADQERIFERFARAVSSTNFGGLGLGLWITREILTRMGGSISVRSVLGKGTTFTVQLPKTPAPPREPSLPVPDRESHG